MNVQCKVRVVGRTGRVQYLLIRSVSGSSEPRVTVHTLVEFPVSDRCMPLPVYSTAICHIKFWQSVAVSVV